MASGPRRFVVVLLDRPSCRLFAAARWPPRAGSGQKWNVPYAERSGATRMLADISPIFMMFALGIILRRTGILDRSAASLFLRLVFHVSLPALILISVSRVDVSRDTIALPLIAGAVVAVTSLVSWLLFRVVVPERKTLGVTQIGSMIMNLNFMYPFVLIVYGATGFAMTVVFDFGNGLLVLTLGYYFACRYGEAGDERILLRIVTAPPLWALVAALVLNTLNVGITGSLAAFLEATGALTIPLIMLALGAYFTPRIVRLRLILLVLAVRVGVGGLVGALLASVIGLEGLTRSIVIVCSAAPVGYNTLIFSSIAKLDVEFAASLVSISILLGMFYIPLLMFALV